MYKEEDKFLRNLGNNDLRTMSQRCLLLELGGALVTLQGNCLCWGRDYVPGFLSQVALGWLLCN